MFLVRASPLRWPVTVGSLIALIPSFFFGWFILAGTFRFGLGDDRVGRSEYFSALGAALAQGRLSTPANFLEFECFIVDGECVGYFGPVPALLRLPALVIAGMDPLPDITIPMMLAAWLLWLVALFVLIRSIVRALPHVLLPPIVSGMVAAAVTALASVGSPVFFLLSRPYVYEEALLWAVTFALWSVVFLWLWWKSRHTTYLIVAFILGIVTIQTRFPTGVGIAAVFAFVGLLLPRQWGWRSRAFVLTQPVVALASYAVINWMRFGLLFSRPESAALSVSGDPDRLELYEQSGFVSPGYIIDGIVAFWRPDGVGFKDGFPWITFPYVPSIVPPPLGSTETSIFGLTITLPVNEFVELEPVASLPGTQLLSLMLLGLVLVGLTIRRQWLPRIPQLDRLMGAVLLGLAVAPAIMLVSKYKAHRYVAEAAPLLAFSVLMAAALSMYMMSRSNSWGRYLVAAGLLFGALVQAWIQYSLVLEFWPIWTDSPQYAFYRTPIHEEFWRGLLPFVPW